MVTNCLPNDGCKHLLVDIAGTIGAAQWLDPHMPCSGQSHQQLWKLLGVWRALQTSELLLLSLCSFWEVDDHLLKSLNEPGTVMTRLTLQYISLA